MQMNTLMSSHIVLFARIYEEVGLCSCLNTSVEKAKTVLRHYGIVVITCYYLELSLEILRLADEAYFLIALYRSGEPRG